MVVFVMSRSNGHAQIHSRHVDVMFPRPTSADSTELVTTPSAPVDIPAGSYLRGSLRNYPVVPQPKPLVSSEWMSSLVQFVASQKKIFYDSAREDLGDALKQSIPMELRENLLRQSDVRFGGITKVGRVPDQVSTHHSLTSTMSMRQLQQQQNRLLQTTDATSAGCMDEPLMHLGTHCDEVDVEDRMSGRLEALVGNAILQAARALRSAESESRIRLEKQHCLRALPFIEDLEVELRSSWSQTEAKEWKKLCGREVGDYLAARRREQTSSRNSTISKAAERLKSEKETLKREVQTATAKENAESAEWTEETERVFRECLEELPTGPNTSQIDAEVARLILRERRQKTEYFPDVL